MKSIFLITTLSFLFINFSFSQSISYLDLKDYKSTGKSMTMTQTINGEYLSYLASDNALYKIGDRIKIGFPSSNKTFAFIKHGDGMLIPVQNLPASFSGDETEIKKIWVIGNKKTGYSVAFRTKGVLTNMTIQFENALASGEVKGFGLTSSEALTKLKEAKDKLDLELIDSIEYQKIKNELSKFIKN